jgi:hypothetical protein
VAKESDRAKMEADRLRYVLEEFLHPFLRPQKVKMQIGTFLHP